MKSIALFALFGLIAIATAAPADNKKEPIAIVRSAINGPNPDGSYQYSYETGNGIKAEEQGEIKSNGDEDINTVQGSYSYTADDGSEVEVRYTADENGFKPQGSHIPQAPEIPEGILRALEWIANHPEEDNL